ncbi:MAG: hypothetical protein IMZ73_05705 [Chloroflexi bacterium]|nr:hypothetical protein [Chloroflexota bacterium]
MLDEGNAPDTMETPDAPPPEEKSNRTFRTVAGVMAALVLLTLLCAAVYFLVIQPRTAAQNVSVLATREALNAQNIQKTTLTAQAALQTATLPPTPLPLRTSTSVPKTPVASPTPVIAIPVSSPAATATTDPATLAAMQTQLSYQMTSTFFVAQGTPGINGQGMPSTGFFDEVGLPSMIILALALVVVILLARRMRKSPTK